MRCAICKKKAEVYLPHHNLALCREDFIKYFHKRIKKAIEDFKMFSEEDKLLIAVSGGKDSLALWDSLLKMGYKVTGLFIDLGIDEFSRKALSIVQEFSEKRDAKLITINIKDEFGGKTLPEIVEITKGVPCKVCGKIKRYYFDRVALKENFDVLITGHNLDDESAFLLGNIFNWNIEYLAKQMPALPEEDGFKKKAKPLIYLTERETAIYAFFSDIEYNELSCPFSKKAKTHFYKESLHQMELSFKGLRIKFYKGFLRNRKLFEKTEKKYTLKPCKLCGYPTSSEICGVCKIKIKAGLLKEDK